MERYLIPITACVFACARIIYTVYNIYTQCHEDEHLHDQWEDDELDWGEDANPVEPAFIAEDELDWELEVNGGRWLDINGHLMWLPWHIIEGDAGYWSS